MKRPTRTGLPHKSMNHFGFRSQLIGSALPLSCREGGGKLSISGNSYSCFPSTSEAHRARQEQNVEGALIVGAYNEGNHS